MKEESEFNDGEPGSKVNADTLERAGKGGGGAAGENKNGQKEKTFSEPIEGRPRWRYEHHSNVHISRFKTQKLKSGGRRKNIQNHSP